MPSVSLIVCFFYTLIPSHWNKEVQFYQRWVSLVTGFHPVTAAISMCFFMGCYAHTTKMES